jgi:hypothetical protein
MQPSIGRIVHYVTAADKHVAAIVTAVWTDTCVNLRLFHDGSNTDDGQNVGEWVTSRSLNDSAQPGTWHWPEKV